jgi:hypothetical protein
MPICTLTQCPPGRVIQNSSELLSSSELTVEFFCALLAPAQCPPGRALQNSKRVFVCNCVLLTALPSEVFNNLKVFPELMISAFVPTWHVFV